MCSLVLVFFLAFFAICLSGRRDGVLSVYIKRNSIEPVSIYALHVLKTEPRNNIPSRVFPEPTPKPTVKHTPTKDKPKTLI